MKQVLELFDDFLSKKGLSFEATVIGGAALNIMDVTDRVTRDVDFIDPEIPLDVKGASIEFAKENPNLGLDSNNWINNGPISIIRDLEVGWQLNLRRIFEGKSLILFTLSRIDLLKTKLCAYCDRDTDFDDCVALQPSLAELDECYPWVLKYDGSEYWPSQVDEQFKRLKEALGYE